MNLPKSFGLWATRCVFVTDERISLETVNYKVIDNAFSINFDLCPHT